MPPRFLPASYSNVMMGRYLGCALSTFTMGMVLIGCEALSGASKLEVMDDPAPVGGDSHQGGRGGSAAGCETCGGGGANPESGGGGNGLEIGGAGGTGSSLPSSCEPGDYRSCYSADPSTKHAGICHGGEQGCADDGTWETDCAGEVIPAVEDCSTQTDEDCDGIGWGPEAAGCLCEPGVVRSCWTGPSGLEGVGVCVGGTETCKGGGLGWDSCTGQVLPTTERCGNGLDDDCNGSVDEGCKIILGGGTANGGCWSDTWQWNGAKWKILLDPGTLCRFNAASASVDGSILLFGGVIFNSFPMTAITADFLRWDGTNWVDGPGALPRPQPRSGAAMVGVGENAILFGGSDYSLGEYYADTWIWDGTSWTEKQVPGPSARIDAASGVLNGKFVLFGGASDLYVGLGDTWEWDGTSWTEKDVPGPSPRVGAAMAPLRGKLILFGGSGCPDGPLGYCGDTWEWDGASWNELDVVGPSPRGGHVMASAEGKIMLFGGYKPISDEDADETNETWTWNGVAWKKHVGAGPGARTGPTIGTIK